MHNIPGMPVGSFAVKPGPIMAAFDIFNVKIIGKGGHATIPQTTIDPIIIGTKAIDAYQSIVKPIYRSSRSGCIECNSVSWWRCLQCNS